VGKRVAKKEVYKFKKGELLSLDSIYDVQGIGGNDWWEPEEGSEDSLIVTRDHHFVITFYE